MKALTIWQPWASLIMGTCMLSDGAIEDGFALPKDVENRHWSCNHRGLLLVHAGKQVDRDWMDLVKEDSLPTGVILGVVEMCGCSIESGSRWAAGRLYKWKLKNPRPFLTPIAYKGAQGLFDVPSPVIAEALRDIGEVST